MRKSIIIATLAITAGLIAGAQASDREHSYDRRSSHIERHAYDRDDDGRRGERYGSGDHRRSVACQVTEGSRLSTDDLRAKLTSAGYQVWSLEPKRNGCIEARVSQANGSPAKLYVDPATAEIKASR